MLDKSSLELPSSDDGFRHKKQIERDAHSESKSASCPAFMPSKDTSSTPTPRQGPLAMPEEKERKPNSLEREFNGMKLFHSPQSPTGYVVRPHAILSPFPLPLPIPLSSHRPCILRSGISV